MFIRAWPERKVAAANWPQPPKIYIALHHYAK